MTISILAVSVDGSDITKLARFWADVLDQPVNPGSHGQLWDLRCSLPHPADIATIGLLSRIPPLEPANTASPKLKTPPSDATSQ
jgi:hypothetical protein